MIVSGSVSNGVENPAQNDDTEAFRKLLSVEDMSSESNDGSSPVYVAGASAETIRGTKGAEEISARGGNDKITAGAGDDIVNAGAGDDVLAAGRGNDVLDGGAGIDAVRLRGSREDYVFSIKADGTTQARNIKTGEVDTLTNIENIKFSVADATTGVKQHSLADLTSEIGSAPVLPKASQPTAGGNLNPSGNMPAQIPSLPGDAVDATVNGSLWGETLRGTEGRDHMRGLLGRDVLLAGGGDDVLVGGAGHDQLYGGGGTDRAVQFGPSSQYRVRDTQEGVVLLNRLSGSQDFLNSVEYVTFLDGTFSISEILSRMQRF